jgi:hypothetical protein
MKGKPIPHDPFHDDAPQVKAHIPPPEPPELKPIDSDASRARNVKPNELEDEGFRAKFKHEAEHDREFNYYDRKKIKGE